MSNIELRMTNVEVGSPHSHFSIQHSVFIILRFFLSATGVVTLHPSGPGPYRVPGRGRRDRRPSRENGLERRGLRGIFVPMLPKGPGAALSPASEGMRFLGRGNVEY